MACLRSRVLLGTLVLVFSTQFLGQANPGPTAPRKSQSAANKKTPKDDLKARRIDVIFGLFEEAYGVAQELPSAQRLEILKSICQSAPFVVDQVPAAFAALRPNGAPLKPPTQLDAKYQERLGQWSEELYRSADELTGNAKVSTQVAAVRAMVKVDDKRALEMLDGIDPPDYGQQDQRSILAMFVFSDVLNRRGPNIVPELRRRALQLGDNDAFPYSAINAVMNQLQGHPAMVRQLFSDSLTYYRRSTDPYNPTFGILAMLRSRKVTVQLEPWQVHDAAEAIATRLRSVVEEEKRAAEDGKPRRPGVSIIVSSARESLKSTDPDLAATIPDPPPNSSRPTLTTSQPTEFPASPPDDGQKKLRAEFEKTSTALMSLSEDEVTSGRELQQTIDRGVDQGAEVARSMTDQGQGSDWERQTESHLRDFIQVGSRLNPAMTLAAVRRIQDAELKARLLLTIANTVQQ